MSLCVSNHECCNNRLMILKSVSFSTSHNSFSLLLCQLNKLKLTSLNTKSTSHWRLFVFVNKSNSKIDTRLAFEWQWNFMFCFVHRRQIDQKKFIERLLFQYCFNRVCISIYFERSKLMIVLKMKFNLYRNVVDRDFIKRKCCCKKWQNV